MKTSAPILIERKREKKNGCPKEAGWNMGHVAGKEQIAFFTLEPGDHQMAHKCVRADCVTFTTPFPQGNNWKIFHTLNVVINNFLIFLPQP
jgi:hypothetical protein